MATPRAHRHVSVEPNLRSCLGELNGSNYAHRDAEERRLTPFESGNVEHEKMLVELWTLLRPGVTLEDRYTRQWGDIGFQGRHPSSDFRCVRREGSGVPGLTISPTRPPAHPPTATPAPPTTTAPSLTALSGMGMLGLHHMLYLARRHTVRAQGIVVDTMRDNGYPFAITSINVTRSVWPPPCPTTSDAHGRPPKVSRFICSSGVPYRPSSFARRQRPRSVTSPRCTVRGPAPASASGCTARLHLPHRSRSAHHARIPHALDGRRA